jgi:REP element-mobilizing transposase RayT
MNYKKLGDIQTYYDSLLCMGRLTAERLPQQELFKTRGGKRAGAGRPRKQGRASEKHQVRERFAARHPSHISLRVDKAVGQLRRRRAYKALRDAMRVSLGRDDFRIVHVSLQRDHIHLIVEASGAMALARGMQALEVSAARRLNAAISVERGVKRRGRVFTDRYHVRVLKTPREVRNAINYVLNNWRHHGHDRGFESMFWEIDPFSSAGGFCGWSNLTTTETPRDDLDEPDGSRPSLPIAAPQTWLLNVGWMKHGLLRVDHVPGEMR